MPAHHSAFPSFCQILSLFCSTSLGLIHHSLIHPKAQEVLLSCSEIFLSFKMNLFTGEDINISSTRPFKVPVLVTLRNKGKWHWCNRSIVACALYPQRRLICFFPLLVLIKSLCSRKMEKFSGKSSKLPFPPLCLIQFVLSKIPSGEQIIKQVPSSAQGMPSMSFSLH